MKLFKFKSFHYQPFYLLARSKNYYEVLNVSQNATKEEIKNRFHELAKIYHPDSSQGKINNTEEIFKEIIQAYKILTDDKQRTQYNSQLDDELKKPHSNMNQENKSQSKDQQDGYSQPINTRKPRRAYQNKGFYEGDYVEEGFLNTLRKAPELSFLTFIIIMIMVKWYMVLLESRRVISQTYPEDPEFIEERNRKLKKNKQKQKSTTLSQYDDLQYQMETYEKSRQAMLQKKQQTRDLHYINQQNFKEVSQNKEEETKKLPE